MGAPVQMPLPPEGPDYLNYAWMGFLAFCGAFMRVTRWMKDNGAIDWMKVVGELFTAIAVGAVAIGIGDYENISKPVVGAVAGLGGFLGPAGFEAILNVIRSKIGGANGPSGKP